MLTMFAYIADKPFWIPPRVGRAFGRSLTGVAWACRQSKGRVGLTGPLGAIGIELPGRRRFGARRQTRSAGSRLCVFGSPHADAGAPLKRGARHVGSRLCALIGCPDSKRTKERHHEHR